ncbi:PucR family transcriptional regulator [Streptomyces himalayensis]|uniref:PucR family transcriptional regulator n=1 Tax=Streptomyces himalayensis TaxID=2820085 RepID=UPI0028B23F89|nr:PucR family transcriptional regulator [Streptomyces himalayensis]
MPDPAAPPTPPVPLAALLAREDLGLRQIAGPAPADEPTMILWAHTSEMADPYPYLLGGELLLTAGVHATEAAGTGSYFDDYVSRIVEAGGAALGFGVAPVHDTVPRALIAACDRYGLPLIEVPPRTTFSAVARAVWGLMAQVRHAELRRVTEAQQGLAVAAARPDPVPAVLRQLAQRLGGWSVLFAPDGTEAASSGRPPAGEALHALSKLAGVVRPAVDTGTGKAASGPGESPGKRSPGTRPSSAADTVSGTHLTAYALGGGQGSTLGIATDRREPGDHTIAGVAVVLLSLLTGEHESTTGAARSTALVRLLLGAAAEEVAPLLGGERWVVVHARPDSGSSTRGQGGGTSGRRGGTEGACGATGSEPGGHAEDTAAAISTNGAGGAISAAGAMAAPGGVGGAGAMAAPGAIGTATAGTVTDRAATDPVSAAALGAALGAALRTALVDAHDDVVRLLVPADHQVTAQPGWTLGVSALSGAHELAVADTQAARALTRALATRSALVPHSDRSGLAALVAQDEADAHARVLLAPLTGTPQGPALTETLRTWLSLHGSWDRTAVALSVHRNTVRQRIARCAALLDRDLDDPDVRMELWFALRQTGQS